MRTILLALCTLWMCNFSEANFDVYIAKKEVKKFLYDLTTDLYIVKNGKVPSAVRNPDLTSLIPVIEHNTDRLKMHFRARTKMAYAFSLESSDLKVMKTPTANIPLTGPVPQNNKEFRIKFPCTGFKSGQVILKIVLQFKTIQGADILQTPVTIALRRTCKAQGEVTIPYRPPRDCGRRCNKTYMLRRFCVSDFAIRAKIEYQEVIGDRILLHVKVTRKFKTGRVKIEHQSILEVRGPHVGCDCEQLKIGQVYLILGKEDRRSRVLFVDNYTAALVWQKLGDGSSKHTRRVTDVQEEVKKTTFKTTKC